LITGRFQSTNKSRGDDAFKALDVVLARIRAGAALLQQGGRFFEGFAAQALTRLPY